MFTCLTRCLQVGVVFLLVLPPLRSADWLQDNSIWKLRRDVEKRERQLTRTQRDLAEARARVALAEGKRDLAITELGKAVDGYQKDVQWIRDHASWFCDPRDSMAEAQWDLAKARAWKAEVECDFETLVAECKIIVGFYEQKLSIVRELEQMMAVKPEEKNGIQELLITARKRLDAVEKQLAAEKSRKSGSVKYRSASTVKE